MIAVRIFNSRIITSKINSDILFPFKVNIVYITSVDNVNLISRSYIPHFIQILLANEYRECIVTGLHCMFDM